MSLLRRRHSPDRSGRGLFPEEWGVLLLVTISLSVIVTFAFAARGKSYHSNAEQPVSVLHEIGGVR